MVQRILPGNVAVLYLRMSDERQERSIGDQRTELLALASKQGYKVLREYLDEAISGDDTLRRTGFLHMREDAAKGEFSVVLCWDQDRFGRFDPIEGGYWILPFRNAGVRLETIAQGKIDWTDFAGRLIYLVQQEGKHAYLRDLSRNSIRGQVRKAKEGEGNDGSTPYGYRRIDGARVIVPELAEIVRRIFALYLLPDGSLRGITHTLNADGIPSPTAKKWTTSTIRGILRNRKHTGAYVWGKQAKGRYHALLNGEVVSRSKSDGNTVSEPIVHEGRFEPIIDDKTFDRAQRLLAKRKQDTSPLRGKGQYILTGLLRCGHCGSSMAGVGTKGGVRHYGCSGYFFGGKSSCTCNRIDEAPLVEAIVRLIQQQYLSVEAIKQLREVLRQRIRAKAAVPVNAGRLRRRIEDLDGKIEVGAERVFSAPAGIVPSLYVKLDQFRAERDRLQAELDAAERPGKGSDNQEEQEVDEAIETLQNLRQAFKEADPGSIRQLLSSVVSKVELRFQRHQHGKYTRTTFSDGTIHVRPDPKLSGLVTPGTPCC